MSETMPFVPEEIKEELTTEAEVIDFGLVKELYLDYLNQYERMWPDEQKGFQNYARSFLERKDENPTLRAAFKMVLEKVTKGETNEA